MVEALLELLEMFYIVYVPLIQGMEKSRPSGSKADPQSFITSSLTKNIFITSNVFFYILFCINITRLTSGGSHDNLKLKKIT